MLPTEHYLRRVIVNGLFGYQVWFKPLFTVISFIIISKGEKERECVGVWVYFDLELIVVCVCSKWYGTKMKLPS
jgi:hypothetical protein